MFTEALEAFGNAISFFPAGLARWKKGNTQNRLVQSQAENFERVFKQKVRLGHMAEKYDGNFSANLFSLQLQLKTLMAGVGGDHALSFLDTLSKLHPSEQSAMLGIFERVSKRILEGSIRFPTQGDLALQEFEDKLYHDLVKDLDASNSNKRSNSQKSDLKNRKLEVLNGGKDSQSSSRSLVASNSISKPNTPIDFAQARKDRKSPAKSLLN